MCGQMTSGIMSILRGLHGRIVFLEMGIAGGVAVNMSANAPVRDAEKPASLDIGSERASGMFLLFACMRDFLIFCMLLMSRFCTDYPNKLGERFGRYNSLCL